MNKLNKSVAIKLNEPTLLKNQCYLNGQWIDSKEGKVINVQNPATEETITTVPSLDEDLILQTISSAYLAQQTWSKISVKERSMILRRWFNLMIQHQDDLAIILTTEQGKPLEEARDEIAYGASYIEWFAEEAKRIYGDIIPSRSLDERILITKQAIGVCAAVTPWNFPNAMITRKAAPALAAGCSFIVRPASQTPLSALAIAELAHQAGIPPGVFNVITGDPKEIGQILTKDERIRKFSFTGSTSVGSELIAQCAPSIKKVTMELGGNAPFIIFEDANIDQAVQGAMLAKFRNAGQTCICANRFYVHKKVYDLFIKKLTQKVNQLKIGNGLEKNTDIGPLIDKKAIDKIKLHIEDGLSKGAKIVMGGEKAKQGENFFQPTILKDVSQNMLVTKEETFGPLLPIIPFESEEEAISFANDTAFGLASYAYTKDLGRALRLSDSLQYGMVGINSATLSNETAPFGGIKHSGMGREGSKYGIEDYLEIKYTLLGGLL